MFDTLFLSAVPAPSDSFCHVNIGDVGVNLGHVVLAEVAELAVAADVYSTWPLTSWPLRRGVAVDANAVGQRGCPRIIYTRFCSKSAFLLHRIKNENTEADIQKLIAETLGPLQGKQEVFKEGTTFKSAPYWSFCELHLPAGLLELAGRLMRN